MVFLEDLRHYKSFCCWSAPLPIVFLRSVIAHPSVMALLLYRYGNWALRMPPLIKQVLMFIHWLFFPLVRLVTGVQILPQTKVGPGLVLLHYGTTIINPRSRIGNQCVFYHNVLLAADSNLQCPVIEDYVLLGANSSVIGAVKVGTGSAIGIGAVVTKDIEPYSIAAGVPAKVIRSRHVNDF